MFHAKVEDDRASGLEGSIYHTLKDFKNAKK